MAQLFPPEEDLLALFALVANFAGAVLLRQAVDTGWSHLVSRQHISYMGLPTKIGLYIIQAITFGTLLLNSLSRPSLPPLEKVILG